jgi:hypothetical protein
MSADSDGESTRVRRTFLHAFFCALSSLLPNAVLKYVSDIWQKRFLSRSATQSRWAHSIGVLDVLLLA